jgi:hypothetical protein
MPNWAVRYENLATQRVVDNSTDWNDHAQCQPCFLPESIKNRIRIKRSLFFKQGSAALNSPFHAFSPFSHFHLSEIDSFDSLFA